MLRWLAQIISPKHSITYVQKVIHPSLVLHQNPNPAQPTAQIYVQYASPITQVQNSRPNLYFPETDNTLNPNHQRPARADSREPDRRQLASNRELSLLRSSYVSETRVIHHPSPQALAPDRASLGGTSISVQRLNTMPADGRSRSSHNAPTTLTIMQSPSQGFTYKR